MTPELIETGLRAIDLLAPLPAGGDVLITGDPKSGVRLLGTELAVRLATLPAKPFHTIVYLDPTLPEADKVLAEFAEASPALTSVFLVREVTSSDLSSHRAARSGQTRDAVMAVATSPRFVHGFRQAVRFERSKTDAGALTALVACEERLPGPFDVTLTCSRAIAAEAIFPALDTRMTVSSASSDRGLGDRHRKTADEVRFAVSEVIENLREGAINDETWFFNTDPGGRAAVQLLCYLSQPYFVAEPYTGLKAAFIPVADTLSGFEAILGGRLANIQPGSFRFRNSLPS